VLPWRRIEKRPATDPAQAAGPRGEAPGSCSPYESDGLTLHRHEPPLVRAAETTEQVARHSALSAIAECRSVAAGQWHTGLSGGAVVEQESPASGDQAACARAGSRSGEFERIIRAARGGQQLGDPGGEREGLLFAPPIPPARCLQASAQRGSRTPVGVHCSNNGVNQQPRASAEVVLPMARSRGWAGFVWRRCRELDLRWLCSSAGRHASALPRPSTPAAAAPTARPFECCLRFQCDGRPAGEARAQLSGGGVLAGWEWDIG